MPYFSDTCHLQRTITWMKNTVLTCQTSGWNQEIMQSNNKYTGVKLTAFELRFDTKQDTHSLSPPIQDVLFHHTCGSVALLSCATWSNTMESPQELPGAQLHTMYTQTHKLPFLPSGLPACLSGKVTGTQLSRSIWLRLNPIKQSRGPHWFSRHRIMLIGLRGTWLIPGQG